MHAEVESEVQQSTLRKIRNRCVVPLLVAFAILAGLPPQYGLYAAMIPPALAAMFGSSLHMVSGPTNAIAIVIFALFLDKLGLFKPEESSPDG